MNTTARKDNGSLVEAVPIGGLTPLPPTQFNFTNFEYILNSGSPSISPRADIIDIDVQVDQIWRLQESLGIEFTIMTSVMEFALAITRLPLSEYSNATTLAACLEKAHQLLFALAVQSMLSTEMVNPNERLGVKAYQVQAITIVRPLSLAMEAALGIFTILTSTLLYRYHARRSEMIYDPASIFDIMKMIDWRHKPAVNACREPWLETECTSRVSLKNGMLHTLTNAQHGSDSKGNIENVSPRYAKRCMTERSPTDTPRRPWEIRLPVGITFTLFILSMLVVVILLQRLAIQGNGLQQPSDNQVVSQLVASYLPVVFATLLEPFWTLLNRVLCVLPPFETLKNVNGLASKSLKLRYCSVPPQLTFWRAIRAHNFLLASVSVIGLSANILAVALAGFFLTESVSVRSGATFQSLFEPEFVHVFNVSAQPGRKSPYSNGPDPGIFFIASSSVGTPSLMPPWTSNETFYVPFKLANGRSVDQNSTFQGSTMGFRVDFSCEPIEYDSEAWVRLASIEGSAPQVKLRDGRVCNNTSRGPLGGQSNKLAALEELTPLSDPEVHSQLGKDTCTRAFLAGFLRGNLSLTEDDMKTDNADENDNTPGILRINALSSMWMTCEQRLNTAHFEVRVDQAGRVLESSRLTPYATDNTAHFKPPLNETFFMNNTREIFRIAGNTGAYWHNDTFVDSWFGYFVKSMNLPGRLTDPAEPVPRYEDAFPVVQKVWQRIFCIQLSMNRDWLAAADSNSTFRGNTISSQKRLFVSWPAFIVVVSLTGVESAWGYCILCRATKIDSSEITHYSGSNIRTFRWQWSPR